jgi:hypothetical protein
MAGTGSPRTARKRRSKPVASRGCKGRTRKKWRTILTLRHASSGNALSSHPPSPSPAALRLPPGHFHPLEVGRRPRCSTHLSVRAGVGQDAQEGQDVHTPETGVSGRFIALGQEQRTRRRIVCGRRAGILPAREGRGAPSVAALPAVPALDGSKKVYPSRAPGRSLCNSGDTI